jgi:hypothetical protein
MLVEAGLGRSGRQIQSAARNGRRRLADARIGY